jgi:hypothetical protein
MNRPLSICALLLLATGFASAQCSASTAAGSWGFSIEGYAPSTETDIFDLKPARPAGEPSNFFTINPFTFAGIITFDGQGHFIATFVLGSRDTVTGTYTVNPNCSFTLYGMPYSPLDGVFVNNFTELLFVTGQGGFVGSGSGAKTSSAVCNNESPAGSWGYTLQGYVGSSTANFAAVGILIFDGAGHLTSPTTWVSYGATSSQPGITGTYTVYNDCTFSMQLYGLPGPSYQGAFTNGVTEFFMVETNGDSVSGTGKTQGVVYIAQPTARPIKPKDKP